jgi:hypothetical protein
MIKYEFGTVIGARARLVAAQFGKTWGHAGEKRCSCGSAQSRCGTLKLAHPLMQGDIDSGSELRDREMRPVHGCMHRE